MRCHENNSYNNQLAKMPLASLAAFIYNLRGILANAREFLVVILVSLAKPRVTSSNSEYAPLRYISSVRNLRIPPSRNVAYSRALSEIIFNFSFYEIQRYTTKSSRKRHSLW